MVEAELGDGVAELLEIGGVDREEAAEDNRLDQLEARQGVRGGLPHVGDRVYDTGLGDVLYLGGYDADLAGAELRELLDLWAEGADAFDPLGRAVGHDLDALALTDRPVVHPDEELCSAR